MQFAIDHTGRRIQAAKKLTAHCPLCKVDVIPKCGSINVHHWAHKSVVDCDPWWETESEWHRYWKGFVGEDQLEVVRGRHRADIVLTNGRVLELQHSSISPEEIREREAEYKNMFWLFDGRDLAPGPVYDVDGSWLGNDSRLLLRPKGEIHTFRWMHPRKSYAACRKPVFIDLDDDRIFILRKLHLENGPPYGGWGQLGTHAQFISTILAQ